MRIKSYKNSYTLDTPIVVAIFNCYLSHNGSKSVNIGESLEYKRELDNKYDPFTISIHKDGEMLGYKPKEKLMYVRIQY